MNDITSNLLVETTGNSQFRSRSALAVCGLEFLGVRRNAELFRSRTVIVQHVDTAAIGTLVCCAGIGNGQFFGGCTGNICPCTAVLFLPLVGDILSVQTCIPNADRCLAFCIGIDG